MGLTKQPQHKANHPTRLICIPCSRHQKRGKGQKHGTDQTGPTSDGTLRIVTDLLDVPAHIIAFLYQYRWMIKVFFRFLKQILGCRHLLSTKIQGIQISQPSRPFQHKIRFNAIISNATNQRAERDWVRPH